MKITRKNIIVSLACSGQFWLIECIKDNHLVTRKYIGYTKREAIKRFLQDINSK